MTDHKAYYGPDNSTDEHWPWSYTDDMPGHWTGIQAMHAARERAVLEAEMEAEAHR